MKLDHLSCDPGARRTPSTCGAGSQRFEPLTAEIVSILDRLNAVRASPGGELYSLREMHAILHDFLMKKPAIKEAPPYIREHGKA